MTPLVALLALAAAAADLPATWERAGPLGWTADGKTLAWELEASEGGEGFHFLLLTDPEGRTQALYQRGRFALPDKVPCTGQPCPGSLYRGARPEEAAEQWIEANPLGGKKGEHDLPSEDATAVDRKGAEPLTLRMAVRGRGCRVVSLVATLGTTSGVAREDHCAPDELANRQVLANLQVVWAPDGTRAALAWHVSRLSPGGGGIPSVARSHLLVLTRRSLAGIDLLDAGAGKALEAIGQKLAGAGFRIQHRGKAGKRRTATEVYFAPGFEKEAREAAALAGAMPDAVKPLDWKTPYAITVAAGAQ